MNATKQGTAVIAILTLSLVACGQEEPIRFNRIPFDSNQLAPLLKTGSVVPIKRADFQQRLKSAADQIAPRDTITVDRAVYAANFGAQKLSGTFKLRLPKQKTADESKSDWVFLGKPNFDSLSLNAPSVWGRNASGDAIARRGESDSIEGTWSIEGKERQWGTEIVITPI
ncbi:MAG: hypothetical protein AB8G99_03385, partial [Planctomycetaceae bacterium]